MATVEITKENFKSTVTSNDVVLLDFWAEWCGPCRSFAPVFESASDSHPDIVFGKVDTEDQQELAGTFGISSIPTLMAIREGVVLFSQAGALPQQALEQVISAVQDVDMEQVRADIAQQSNPE